MKLVEYLLGPLWLFIGVSYLITKNPTWAGIPFCTAGVIYSIVTFLDWRKRSKRTKSNGNGR